MSVKILKPQGAENFGTRIYRAHKFMHYVYLIRNNSTGDTYTGQTSNLKRRLIEYKNKKPKLIYYEAYFSAVDAKDREYKLKQRGQTVRRLKERLKNSLGA